MEPEKKKVYIGVYGIFRTGDRVLVIKKARGPYMGLYDLPGGGLNFEETVGQCLDRELMEETNTKVLSRELAGVNEYQCQYRKEDGTLKDFHHLGIYYTVDLKVDDLKTAPDGQDSNGAEFVDVSELTAQNTSPICFPMIQGTFAS